MAGDLPSLHPLPPEDRAAIEQFLQSILDRFGYRPRRMPEVLHLMAMLLPNSPPQVVAALVLQSVWVYAVDALVDGFAPDLDERFRRWVQSPLEPDPDDPEHRLLAAMWSVVIPQTTLQDRVLWQRALEVFLAAQQRQHAPPQSYLDYLEVRVIANGLPSLAALAAVLLQQAAALDTLRVGNLIRWGGIFTSLVNDLHSYERELAEGTAANANALGVLMGLAAQQGASLDIASAKAIVQTDCDAAVHMFATQLGEPTTWSAIDIFVARAVALVRDRHVV